MTKENVTRYTVKCPICKTIYLPEIGEICKCDRPEPEEEPRVKDYEDVKQTQP